MNKKPAYQINKRKKINNINCSNKKPCLPKKKKERKDKTVLKNVIKPIKLILKTIFLTIYENNLTIHRFG